MATDKALATALKKQEAVIEKGQAAFVAVGQALMIIRDRKLYRGEYKSFAAYCQTRWGYVRSRAYQYIDAAKITQKNVHISVPTEAVARELTKLPDSERAEVVEKAVKSSKSGTPTAPAVRREVAKRKAAAPVDQVGQQIKQPKVAEAFERVGELTTVKNRVHSVGHELQTLAADPIIGKHLDRQQLAADIRNLAAALRFAMPYAICPYCKGKACEHCKRAGWMPRAVYERTPGNSK